MRPNRDVRFIAPALLGAIAAAALGAGGGCFLGEEDRPLLWDRERAVLGPIPLKDRVAYVDSALDRVVALDLSSAGAVADGEAVAAPPIAGFAIGRRAIHAVPSPDRERLLVVTRGEEALVEGQVEQAPLLWQVDVAHPGSAPISYPIGSPFDRLAISPEGQIAVAYFSASGPDADGFFRNPNELAIVDLSRPPAEDNPTLLTIRSFGSVPAGIVLSPPMVIPGASDPAPRTFAFVLAQNNLTVIDATHPERNEVSIRLDLGDEPVEPREIVFAPDSAAAYLRSDNARDVLEIFLTDDPPATDDPRANDYRPVLAELGAGGGPSDIAVYDDAAGRRFVLAATPNTGEIVVIDADTAQFRAIPVADPIDRILLFPDGTDQAPRKAVLASVAQGLPRLHVLALEQITDELAQIDLETIELGQPVLDLVPVPGRDMAMVVHDDQRTVLGLLDMAFGSVSPLQGIGRLDDYAFTPDGRHLLGATRGSERIGLLDLDNLHPSDLRLDDLPTRLLAMPNGAIFVDHGDPLGRATIVPGPGASRDQALVLQGFLLGGILDTEPSP